MCHSYFKIFKKILKINPFFVILIILIVYCYLALLNSYYNFQISSNFLHKLLSYFSQVIFTRNFNKELDRYD